MWAFIERYKWELVSSWALVAFVSWHYESSCGVFFYSDCFSFYWDGFRWIALLKWVEPYQTLLAGLAALAAGKFALTAAQHSSENAIRLENSKSRDAATIACSIVADDFRDAEIAMTTVWASVTPKKFDAFVRSQAYLPTVHYIDPMLGSVVSAAIRDLSEYVAAGQYLYAGSDDKLQIARCHAIYLLLVSISNRLDVAGKFALSSGEKVSSADLGKRLTALGVSPTRLIGLYSLFDWSQN